MKSVVRHTVVLILATLVATPLFYATEAVGSPADCESIKDSDARSYCRAVTTGKAFHCESIRNNDLRNRCRALVRK